MITQSKKSVSPPTFWEKEPHWMEKRSIFQFKRTRALPASAGRERGARRAVLGALEGCAGRGGVGGAAGRGLAGGAAGHGLGRWLAARPGRGGGAKGSQPAWGVRVGGSNGRPLRRWPRLLLTPMRRRGLRLHRTFWTCRPFSLLLPWL